MSEDYRQMWQDLGLDLDAIRNVQGQGCPQPFFPGKNGTRYGRWVE